MTWPVTQYPGTVFTCDAVPGWASKGVDDQGVRWKAKSITGWDEPPDTREAYTARVGDGYFDGPAYDESRLVTWIGSVQAPTRELRQAAKLTIGRLAQAFHDGAELVGYDEDGPKSVQGRRSPGWKIAPFGLYGLQYQAVIRCVDPYKYGPAVSLPVNLPSAGAGGMRFPLFRTSRLAFGLPGVTGRLALSNPGTREAWPRYDVMGPIYGGVVLSEVESGRNILFPDDIPAGAVLTLDSATGTATLNGADRSGRLAVAQWWSVPPGVAASGGSATPTGDVSVVDAGDGTTTVVSSGLLDGGDGTVTLVSSTLVDNSDGTVSVGTPDMVVAAASTGPTSTLQFATLGSAGQAGSCLVTVRPTYQ